MVNKNYTLLFAELSRNIDLFIKEVDRKRSSLMATDEWSVKDVLCHIVFWHENYADNYRALAENENPPLLVGPGYKLNKDGVAGLRKYSRSELVKRLLKANRSLYKSIVMKGVPKMTYKRDGHIYKTEEFLLLIARHIATHTKQVKRAKEKDIND